MRDIPKELQIQAILQIEKEIKDAVETIKQKDESYQFQILQLKMELEKKLTQIRTIKYRKKKEQKKSVF